MRWTMRGIVGHMVVNTQAVTGLASWMRTASGAVDFMEADEDLPLGGGLLQPRGREIEAATIRKNLTYHR